MKPMHMAESVLNRMLNFMDELAMTDEKGRPMTYWGGLADPKNQGAAIDAALATPPPDLPQVAGMDEALVAKGLKLGPPR